MHRLTPRSTRSDTLFPYTTLFRSPALVATSSVNDWWPQDLAARPWRRLVNEVQMLWYEHPVNQERYKQGLVPINSVWLFGGARSAQIKSMPLADTRIHGDRSEEHTSELQSLMRISYAVFCLKKKNKTINTYINTKSNRQRTNIDNVTR